MSDTEGMNVTEAAAFLRLHRTTVSRLVKQGRIPHRMIGTAPRFSRTALTRWLAGEETAPTAPTAAPMTPHPRLKPKNIRHRPAPTPRPVVRGGVVGVAW